MTVRIIPSIASADPLALRAEISRLGDTPYLHMDIEDGTFVPNITFGLKTVRAIAACTQAELDVHMMLANPEDFIEPLRACGIKRVCAQIEPLTFPARLIAMIRAAGMEPGLAITLKTPVEQLLPYRDQIGYVLILASEPDGQERFNPYALDKIRRVRELLPSGAGLWVDGGIDGGLLPEVVRSGADTVIMGRAIWQAKDPKAQLEAWQNL